MLVFLSILIVCLSWLSWSVHLYSGVFDSTLFTTAMGTHGCFFRTSYRAPYSVPVLRVHSTMQLFLYVSSPCSRPATILFLSK